ncbi:protein LURP-one-related 8-like [Andrographis paniculata]|uniref:protein LURP-one-related 8-like n=1 Tax=Andrographis paniculata TaxID=175694 RepID=UPI0021E89834|nr:protein LURP-one-related 8-like [Andrographis paniculata]
MTKVYPNAASPLPQVCGGECRELEADPVSAVLTVWKKSLIFNCDGFTVFGADGRLVYRVDNYMFRNKGEIVLMDALGNCLLTVRRKRLSLSDSWTVFDGETADNPRFFVRKSANLLNTKCVASVTSAGGGRSKNEMLYEIQGSYPRRCCTFYDDKRRQVAEIRQKESSIKGVDFGADVFRLVVNPGMDAAAAMAIVIVLDQMYGSSTARFFLTN